MGNGQAVGRLGAARVTAWASTIACVLCLAHFAATRPLALLVQPAPVMGLAVAMALFSTVLPVWMVSEAIRRLGAGPVSLIGTLGPVVTLFLGWPTSPSRSAFTRSSAARWWWRGLCWWGGRAEAGQASCPARPSRRSHSAISDRASSDWWLGRGPRSSRG